MLWGKVNNVNLAQFDSQEAAALTSLSNGPLLAQFTADLSFAAIADSLKFEFNEP